MLQFCEEVVKPICMGQCFAPTSSALIVQFLSRNGKRADYRSQDGSPELLNEEKRLFDNENRKIVYVFDQRYVSQHLQKSLHYVKITDQAINFDY